MEWRPTLLLTTVCDLAYALQERERERERERENGGGGERERKREGENERTHFFDSNSFEADQRSKSRLNFSTSPTK